MPRPLSVDLRKRVVAAYERGGVTRDAVAEMFQVGRATVNRLVRQFRATGSVEPGPHGGGKPAKFNPRLDRMLRKLVAEQSDATVPELVEALEAKTGARVSSSTMGRALARLGLTRKKSPSSPASNSSSESKRYARAFVPGRKPWTLVISSSSTRRGRTSG